MKKVSTLILLIMAVCLSFAGIDDFYTFNATTGTYTAITGTQITSIHSDDALSDAIPMGFTFPYGDLSFTEVKVSSNGWIGLGTTQTGSNLSNQLASALYSPVVAPLWDDLSLASGTAQYLSSGTAPARVFTLQYENTRWNYSATNQFNFQARFYESGKIDFIYGTSTGTPSNASASIGINMSPGGSGWYYSVTPGTPSSVSMTTEMMSISTFPANGTIFEFIPATPSTHDLLALSITGNTTPSIGTATNYTVSVRNRGTLAQTNYQVQIVSSTGTVLAFVAGTAIQPNQVLSFTIPWTPTVVGPIIIRGKTLLAPDQNTLNDQSPPLNVTVMPAGMTVVTIGAGDQTARIPLDMYYMNSLFETLYFPTEIGILGNISAITLYSNFFTDLPNKATKIWLGSTTQENLEAGWIPSSQLTQVFDGTVNYPSGINMITIPLQNIYSYTSGNLVMMMNRPMDTQYFSPSDLFLAQTVGTNRSRNVFADGTTLDPANPTGGSVTGQFPKTSLHITPLGTDPVPLINPTAWNFGQVLMNTTRTKAFAIINGGGGTMTVSSVTISGSPFMTLQNLSALPANLSTGQSVNFNVLYAPTSAGNHSATITIVDNTTRQTHTIPLTANCIDPTIYTLPSSQNFDLVTAPNLPLDWTTLITTTSTGYIRTNTNNPFSAPNSVEMYNSADMEASMLLIAPPYVQTLAMNTSRVNFRARAAGTNYTLQVGVMTNSQDAATFTSVQTVNLTNAWAEYVVSFSGYTGTGRYIAFKHGNASTYQNIYIDNVMFEVIPQNDLAAITISGNTTPSVGNQTPYTVTIKNWGTATQTNYTVKLYNSNDVELGSAAGLSVAGDQTVDVQVSWTPSVEGPLSIYGKVILAGDQNPLNDSSPSLAITVMPAGMMVITIGDGSLQDKVPVDMYWRNSLFETLYYPTEIGIFGNITALSFYNNFVTNLPNKPTKIWLGSTTSDNLSGGWIPSTQLTLVFDGTVNYPSGQNTIVIPLQTAYPYTGGNLVMMVNRPMDTQYFNYMDNFYAQTVGTNRSLKVNSDGTEYDPANPPAGITPSGLFPKTTLHITPLGPDPIFMVNPSSKNYGTVLLNSTHNQTFTIMNAGGGTLGINTITIAGAEHFSIQNMPTLPASLNTGQSITFVGRYNPSAAGTHAATITINDNLTRNSSRSSRDRVPHTIALTGICVDPTINELPYLQNFDAVTVPTLPVQWTKIVNTTSTGNIVSSTTNPYSQPNSIYMTNSADAAATMILVAPPYVNTIATNTTRTKFYARGASANHIISVGVMTNPQDASTYVETQSISLTTTWTEYIVTFAAYQGTGRTIAFKLGTGSSYQNVYLDNIMLEVTPQNDLAALAITGNTTPTVGIPTNYTVNVFNWGTNPQPTYQVKLFKQGDIEVASVNGPTVNPGLLLPVVVSWTPDVQGATFIYAKVVLANDQNSLNDQSPNMNVNIQPPGLIAYTIGDGSETARMPLDMYYMNSLYETLYYPAELSNVIGTITGIVLYNDFMSDLPGMPTKIWLGTTTQNDLATDWIPSSQLTLVFDGTVDYPSGQNSIFIPFDDQYLYLNGENIVMMVNRPMDTQYYSPSDLFRSQTVGTNRARNVFSDQTAFDPANPTGGTVSGIFPKTTFMIIPGGVGHLNGTVYGAGGQALPGVDVQFVIGGYHTTTNAQGQYNIQNIIHASYQVSYGRYGYITQTHTVVIPEDTTVTQNVNLVQMPTVSVSGTLNASDTGAGIPGAGISLMGYENYTTSTNTQGQFTIAGVYASQTYDYTIIAPGYQNASGTIVVGTNNYAMGTVVLNEVAYAPRQVSGEIITNNTQVNLEWLPPDPTALDLTDSFETAIFPPENWTNSVTNTGPANTSGVYPTWCRFGPVTISGLPADPTDGSWQAGLWWSYDHQDEWLITPQFNCPPSAYLTFDSYVFLGSTNEDHYYIKISTDGGTNWTVLWDASAQTGGWNYYATPITLDLSSYEGLQVKLAWHAEDPPSNDGIWYVWFIDNVYIGNEVTSVVFDFEDMSIRSRHPERSTNKGERSVSETSVQIPNRIYTNQSASKGMEFASSASGSRSSVSNNTRGTRIESRSLIGYKIWRLIAGQETNDVSWTLLTPELHETTTLIDGSWATLANGSYRWAVKAVYTSNVLSVASFSNVLVKQVINGTIAGVVRTSTSQPVSGATVTAGGYSATTNLVGAYSILIPIGNYSVSATATGYQTNTVENVTVNANQTTTINFSMSPVSNDDDVLPILATELMGNYPNPFNPNTSISYALKDASAVSLEIYNLKGQKIISLVNEIQNSGRYTVSWDGKDHNKSKVASGIYFYRFSAGNYSRTRKMLLME